MLPMLSLLVRLHNDDCMNYWGGGGGGGGAST